MENITENEQRSEEASAPKHAAPLHATENNQAPADSAASAQDPMPRESASSASGALHSAPADANARPFAIAKFALIFCLLAFVFFTVASDPMSDASIDDVSGAVIEAMGDNAETMKEEDGRAFKRDFGLSANDCEGVVYYAPASNMEATEVLVVKLSDTSQQQELRDAIETRVSQQLNTFEGYAPEQAGLMQDAVVDVRGNYVLYAVGSDAQSARSAFAKSL
ncbi:MAG: DUF4358 domain-containing protein [Coriobacteriaceae bacterium]|nr:DUF4358 domain-containing protein [Coriobacteriaceae bacterium]